jgi:hypothetical protein
LGSPELEDHFQRLGRVAAYASVAHCGDRDVLREHGVPGDELAKQELVVPSDAERFIEMPVTLEQTSVMHERGMGKAHDLAKLRLYVGPWLA